jgi:hypothetical protein
MGLWQDLRYAVRLLVKDKWFTAVAAAARALGIGVNNTVFTFVNAVLIRGLPFDEPDRIMALGTLLARSDGDPIALTPLLREEVSAIDPDLPLFRIQTMDESGSSVRIEGVRPTPSGGLR